MKKDFTALDIRAALNGALKEQGVTEPTPIQQQAIPAIMAGKDVIGQAQTGTGKTLAFVLPIMELIDPYKPYVQALIIAPTRELALQITNEAKKLAPVVGVRVLAAYGGQDVESQIRKLKGDVHIVVGTPGRLLDHLRRGTVSFDRLKMLVLDEADQMLHMGFLGEVQELLEQTPYKRQTMLFSATMPPGVRALADSFMRDPAEFRVRSSKQVTLDEIEQVIIDTTDRGKQDALCRTMDEMRPYLAIIFCRTKRRATTLNEELIERGYSVDELHGDLSQAKREQVLKKFREAKIQYLVATDIAARGLDIEGVTHIFNYDIPHDAESYIHRIGRTGRAGETGTAVTFASPRDRYYVELIEKGIKQSIPHKRADGAAVERGEARIRERRTADAEGGGAKRREASGGERKHRQAPARRDGERRGGAVQRERGPRGGGAQQERGPRGGDALQERGPRGGDALQERRPRGSDALQERGPRGGGAQRERGPRAGGAHQERGPRGGGAQRERGGGAQQAGARRGTAAPQGGARRGGGNRDAGGRGRARGR